MKFCKSLEAEKVNEAVDEEDLESRIEAAKGRSRTQEAAMLLCVFGVATAAAFAVALVVAWVATDPPVVAGVTTAFIGVGKWAVSHTVISFPVMIGAFVTAIWMQSEAAAMLLFVLAAFLFLAGLTA